MPILALKWNSMQQSTHGIRPCVAYVLSWCFPEIDKQVTKRKHVQDFEQPILWPGDPRSFSASVQLC